MIKSDRTKATLSLVSEILKTPDNVFKIKEWYTKTQSINMVGKLIYVEFDKMIDITFQNNKQRYIFYLEFTDFYAVAEFFCTTKL